MEPQENEHRKYRGFSMSPELRGVKDASLGFTLEDIKEHCKRVTKTSPDQEANCINLNLVAQKYYI